MRQCDTMLKDVDFTSGRSLGQFLLYQRTVMLTWFQPWFPLLYNEDSARPSLTGFFRRLEELRHLSYTS